MLKELWRKYKLIILFSILFNLIILSLVRGHVGFYHAMLFGLSVYFVFTIYALNLLNKEKRWVKLLMISLGIIIVHVIPRIIDFDDYIISMPEFGTEVIGVLLGYLFFYGNKILKGFAIVLTLATLIMVHFNFDKVLNWMNYNQFKYSLNETDIQINRVPMLDSNRVALNDSLLISSEYLIIEYWGTYCRPCIKAFPVLEKSFLELLNEPRVNIISVCLLTREDSIKSPFKLVREKGFKFPVYVVENTNLSTKYLNIEGVPTTLVVKNKKVLFRGEFKGAVAFVNKELAK